jgi:hypothetical protein
MGGRIHRPLPGRFFADSGLPSRGIGPRWATAERERFLLVATLRLRLSPTGTNTVHVVFVV